MKKKLFVVSIDAMVREDVAYMEAKPNFSKIMSKRAEVNEVFSIYPSITYPAHTTLITGCRPGKHGVCNNSSPRICNDKAKHFHLYHKMIRAEDIFAVAKRAGYTTASVYWPITGQNPNIDYNLNEYFFYYPEETVEEAFSRMGADEAALRAVRENMDRYPSTRGSGKIDITSTFDNFIVGCACSLIRNQRPDVMLVHICNVDSTRHRNGVFSEEVKVSLDRTDMWLGEIVAAMEDIGVYEETNFVILSDHGQMDFERYIRLNVLLARGGFIDIAPNETVYDWHAWAKSNGLSATIHLRDEADEVLRQRVHAYLLKLIDEGCWGIGRIYTAEELREEFGTYGPFSFIVEGDDNTCFDDNWREPVERFVKDEKNPRYRSKHGYDPRKGAKPIFMGRGPAFKEGAAISNAQLFDIAPTLARILGQEMPQAEGCPLEELLNDV